MGATRAVEAALAGLEPAFATFMALLALTDAVDNVAAALAFFKADDLSARVAATALAAGVAPLVARKAPFALTMAGATTAEALAMAFSAELLGCTAATGGTVDFARALDLGD